MRTESFTSQISNMTCFWFGTIVDVHTLEGPRLDSIKAPKEHSFEQIGCTGGYPLVNYYITMENHIF